MTLSVREKAQGYFGFNDLQMTPPYSLLIKWVHSHVTHVCFHRPVTEHFHLSSDPKHNNKGTEGESCFLLNKTVTGTQSWLSNASWLNPSRQGRFSQPSYQQWWLICVSGLSVWFVPCQKSNLFWIRQNKLQTLTTNKSAFIKASSVSVNRFITSNKSEDFSHSLKLREEDLNQNVNDGDDKQCLWFRTSRSDNFP